MTIHVQVADPAGRIVALWERHPDHPGGEIWLAGAGEFEVALTPAVEARLRNGTLVQVEPAIAPTPIASTPAPARPAATEERPEATATPPAPASKRKGGL